MLSAQSAYLTKTQKAGPAAKAPQVLQHNRSEADIEPDLRVHGLAARYFSRRARVSENLPQITPELKRSACRRIAGRRCSKLKIIAATTIPRRGPGASGRCCRSGPPVMRGRRFDRNAVCAQ